MTQGSSPKFCDQCGNPLRETSKFCPECGVTITENIITAPQEPKTHTTREDVEKVYGVNTSEKPTTIDPTVIFSFIGVIAFVAMLIWVFVGIETSTTDLEMSSQDETIGISQIDNRLYETIDLSDLDKELRTIQDEYEKNPNRGPIYDEQMKQKWRGKKVHISGELYGLSNELVFSIKDGKGRALCFLEENQRPKLMSLNNNEKIHVTGTIQQIHYKVGIGTMDYFNKNIVKLIDCQVGHEKDRVTSK